MRPEPTGAASLGPCVRHLDSTGDEILRNVAGDFAEHGIGTLLVDVAENVRDVMDASGFTALVGTDAFLPTDADAVAHLEQPD